MFDQKEEGLAQPWEHPLQGSGMVPVFVRGANGAVCECSSTMSFLSGWCWAHARLIGFES